MGKAARNRRIRREAHALDPTHARALARRFRSTGTFVMGLHGAGKRLPRGKRAVPGIDVPTLR